MSKMHLKLTIRKAPGWLLLAVFVSAATAGCGGLQPGQPATVWPGSNNPAAGPTHMNGYGVGSPTAQPTATQRPAATTISAPPTVRGQDWEANENVAGSQDHFRRPMAVADATDVQQANFQAPPVPDAPPPGYIPPLSGGAPAGSVATPQRTRATITDADQWLTVPNAAGAGYLPPAEQLPGTPVPLDVIVEEARTGRFMIGAGVNSDLGFTGQVTIDERNFDIFGFPTSWAQIANGEAFRGRGQAFRLEAMPGNRVQRYLVSFTEPYLFWTPISLNVSGFLYDRGFFDWNESRAGGRLGPGYRLTPDLSVSGAVRMEDVRITDPRVLGVQQLDRVLGSNDFYSGQASVRHDTRDLPFAPTEGHLFELRYEQAFGEYDYPRGEFELRKYFMVRERPDSSGRHTISVSLSAGFSGSDTPLFENYFAGGFSTLRGFDFRGASPVDSGVIVGGRFRTLGSVEYIMPLTADDMIKGVAFCDFGTVEEEITIDTDNFRVAPGFGFRISVPALGPAPLAFDFAFPVASADTDDEQIFSFFFGASRG
jgi:outer membrane protein insertion porin family